MTLTPNLGITLLDANLRQPETPINNALLILDSVAMVRQMLTDEVSITGTVTLTSSAYGKMHVITGTSADYSITLFTPTADDLGKIIGFRVSNAGTKVYTLDAAGAETIDGLTTLTLRKDDAIYLKAVATTGNTWQVMGRKTGYGAWTSYTPTITSGTGTFTAVSGTINWIQIGKTVRFRAVVTITTNGTAAGYVKVTMPFTPVAVQAGSGFVGENSKGLTVIIATDAIYLIHAADGSYPTVGVNPNLYFSGVIEIA